MAAVCALRNLSTFRCQLQDPGAAVFFRRRPDNKTLVLHAVYRRSHRTGGEQDLVLNGGNGHRSLVQERFKNHEVAETQTRICDALLGQQAESPVSPCKYDPKLRCDAVLRHYRDRAETSRRSSEAAPPPRIMRNAVIA